MQNTDQNTKPPWYLYIIRNRLDQLYTGITTEPGRRFKEHNSQGSRCAKALRGKAPLTLCYCIQLADRSAALKAEIAVKRLSRAQKDTVIAGQTTLDFEHALVAIEILAD